jgi:hypothetical protein
MLELSRKAVLRSAKGRGFKPIFLMKFQHYFRAIAFSVALIGTVISPGFAQTLKRDYEFKQPLPQTKQVTIRQPLKALPSDRVFTRCPKNSQLTEFAESNNFLVMICREGGDLGLKKYWIQQTKKTGKLLQLTAQDKPGVLLSPWQSGDYQVSIYADGRGPINAYLESYNTRTMQGRAEALIYHYDDFYKP